MNRDIASELLGAVSSLNESIVRQNVVCTTYVGARRRCQQELHDATPASADEHGSAATRRFGHVLRSLTVEMRSIACDHEEASNTIDECVGQVYQWSNDLTPSSLELVMALLQSLMESTEAVFSHVELLNEFRDSAHVLLRHGGIHLQASAFIEAFDAVIDAYNHQWFAANDLVDALKSYASESSLLQPPAPEQVGETREDEESSVSTPEMGSSSSSLEVESPLPELTSRKSLDTSELDAMLAQADRRMQEAQEQAKRVRAEYEATRVRIGQIFHEAREVYDRARALHDEVSRTLQWVRSL